MDVKGLLQQYEAAEILVKQLQTEYEKQNAKVDALRSPLGGDGQPGSNAISKSVERQALKLAEKAEALKEAQADALAWRQYIYEYIRTVPGVKGAILYERYINRKTWEGVAAAVGYSRSRTCELHDEAIKFLERK